MTEKLLKILASIWQLVDDYFATQNEVVEVPPKATKSPITNETPKVEEIPIPSKYLWDTPENAYHSVRVICDEEGLSIDEKNLICSCIYQESNFYNTARCENRNKKGKVTSEDVGLVQVNSFYHTGDGKQFPSTDYVVSHPEEAVRWMISMYKMGLLKLWVSYSSGAYRKWLLHGSPMWKLANK